MPQQKKRMVVGRIDRRVKTILRGKRMKLKLRKLTMIELTCILLRNGGGGQYRTAWRKPKLINEVYKTIRCLDRRPRRKLRKP